MGSRVLITAGWYNTVSDQMRLEPPMAPPVGDICWTVTWWAVTWWGSEKGKTGSAACFQRRHAKYIKYSAPTIFTAL